MQGRDLAAMSPAIRRYLEEQERGAAYRALVRSCARQGLEWIWSIDAPRYTVDDRA